jgi:spore photoproduct lyase
MFEQIFVERHLSGHDRFIHIAKSFPKVPIKVIDKVEDVWGRVKKPYLQKRESLNLFVGEKKGQLIKPAPPAYGGDDAPHFYFIHAYNCIYECQYCYLQGYFQTPDLVLFLNHEDIVKEMELIMNSQPEKTIWFHAGEFSDSLALSHITQEIEIYHAFLAKHPKAKIELRTKSVNTQMLKNLSPLDNLIITFSLSPEIQTKTYDLKTPSLKARLKAMEDLYQLGHKLGVHLDPIIYGPNMMEEFEELIDQMGRSFPLSYLEYISLGVVRFTNDVFREVEKNYPDSPLLANTFIESFDHKKRYPKPLRELYLRSIKELLVKKGAKEERIYFCME